MSQETEPKTNDADRRNHPLIGRDRYLWCARLTFVIALMGTALSGVLSRTYPPFDVAHKFQRHDSVGEFVVGWLVGTAFSYFVLLHPFRALGSVAIAGLLWFLVTTYSVLTGVWSGWPHGLPAGVIVIATLRFIRPPNFGFVELAGAIAAASLYPALYAGWVELTVADGQMWFGYALLALTFCMTVMGAVCFRRPFVELALEAPMRVAYRMRAVGPGVAAFPVRQPCLLVANHAAYLDPLFLAGFVPRPITPMMTSNFYDKPIIRQLMVYIFDTIRVPERQMKRDTGEIAAAVEALDAGKCVVIFPEGYLRRKEEQPLRRFGRGVWEILRARPDTPVVACWIEGGWGSYFSFKGGPPTQNKRRDVRRPIDIGVSAPEVVSPDVLADHIATRFHLMNSVSHARRHLGLSDLPPMEPPAHDE